MPDDAISVLLVEDSPGDARLFSEALKEAYGSRFELIHCQTLTQALAALAKTTPQVIVVDLGLPDATGMEVVARICAAALSTPVVVLTGSSDEAAGLQALHEGAQDYLIKGELESRMLSRALRYAVERHRMQEALRTASLIDPLTGLYNRRGFLTLANNHLKLIERTGTRFALVFVDLDGMKGINDSSGHAEGDRALIETAGLLKGCLRQSDILARLGGDEFVLLLDAANENTERMIRDRLRDQVAAFNAHPNRRYHLAFSIGVLVAGPPHSATLEQLLAQADALMYEEKQRKKTYAAGGSS